MRHESPKLSGRWQIIEFFQKVIDSPVSPFIFILGGAKVSDKIPVIENMMDKANSILIGGAMAYTFMKAKGVEVGSSLIQEEMYDTVRKILDKAAEKNVEILLPIDHVVTDDIQQAKNVKFTRKTIKFNLRTN